VTDQFKVRRRGTKAGRPTIAWFPLCKSVAYLYRYAELAAAANRRHLEALAPVPQPRQIREQLHAGTRQARAPATRPQDHRLSMTSIENIVEGSAGTARNCAVRGLRKTAPERLARLDAAVEEGAGAGRELAWKMQGGTYVAAARA
jgi:hypothetical protein